MILTGDILWAELGDANESSPIVVVSSNDYLAAFGAHVLAVPVTSRDRGWPNHVLLTGPTQLELPSYAMTEQVRSVSRERIVGTAGSIDHECLDRMRVNLRDFLDLW